MNVKKIKRHLLYGEKKRNVVIMSFLLSFVKEAAYDRWVFLLMS